VKFLQLDYITKPLFQFALKLFDGSRIPPQLFNRQNSRVYRVLAYRSPVLVLADYISALLLSKI